MLQYPCLVLDHDDTTVDSTRTVNYPQFRQALAHFRPEINMSLEQYIMYCYDPGFYEMCRQILHYTEEELDAHFHMWKEYHKAHHPSFFPGMADVIRRQKEEGGYVCVVSHSSDDVIRNAYIHNNVPLPDLIFGAELPDEQRKPHPWPLQEIMRKLKLLPCDLLVVDDMILGQQMASSANVAFAAAGWCGLLPPIETQMRTVSDHFFSSVEAFSNFLFQTNIDKRAE